ncbi:amidase signature domain-containing protein [Mycena alexandri]|uniref:Amidase signature domain-containing protein n=1 Tax=Mycena alexandri TaxID=1745969 RepID=A0AAD6WWC0_9AGAR|nr:amidase signature domain-containing protein [Mycena alexandri]
MLRDFTSPSMLTVVALLREAGADIVGKLNCERVLEWGMSLNVHSVHGPVVNPFQTASSTVPWADREKRSAGGSSGGSAASVAAKMCSAALSTDTGGSTRLPASYCGCRWSQAVVRAPKQVFVVKCLIMYYTKYSRRWGVISFADSLDCVGVMAGDISTTRDVFDTLNVYDAKDPTSASPDARQRASAAATRACLDGATIVPVSLPSTPYALSAYYVISSAEASSNMARYDGVQYGIGTNLTNTASMYARTRSVGFGGEVQKRRIRQLVRDDLTACSAYQDVLSSNPTGGLIVKGVDVLIHPSAIRTAPPLGTEDTDGLQTYVQDVLTVPASLAGLPALSVPLPTHDHDWPVGISVVGQWGCDDTVLRVGQFLE